MADGTQPLISIITVNLNQAEKLKLTLESVHNQSFDNKEHIVIDGGSTDKSVEVIKTFDNRLAHWESTTDRGIYDAMNKGLSVAKGQWIHFLNAGDAYTNSNALSEIAENLDKAYAIIYCDVMLKGIDNSMKVWIQKPAFRFGLFNNICHQAVFYNTRQYPDLEFDTRFEISADAQKLLEIGSRKGWQTFRKIPGPFVIYEEEGLSFKKAFKALEAREEHFQKWLKNPLLKWLNRLNLKRQKQKYLRKAKSGQND
ncbi:MAG: glycosyltransferase family 2 protein [Bacteroidota bacterium]